MKKILINIGVVLLINIIVYLVYFAVFKESAVHTIAWVCSMAYVVWVAK